jgi:hypothetical protein
MREKLALVAILLALVGCMAGCGGDSREPSADETATTTGGIATSAPIRCLDAAALSDVKERDVGVWSGLRAGSDYAIVVRRLKKPAKVPTVVAGTYAVTGSFKVAAEGTGLTSEEGLEADALVEIVADCLGR